MQAARPMDDRNPGQITRAVNSAEVLHPPIGSAVMPATRSLQRSLNRWTTSPAGVLADGRPRWRGPRRDCTSWPAQREPRAGLPCRIAFLVHRTPSPPLSESKPHRVRSSYESKVFLPVTGTTKAPPVGETFVLRTMVNRSSSQSRNQLRRR